MKASRTIRAALLVIIVVQLLVGGGLLYLRRPAHPVTVDQAVQRYRERVGDEAAADLPAPEAAPTVSDSAATRSPGAQPDAPAGSAGSSGALPPSEQTVDRSAAAMPAPGVYVYDTTGFEEVDAFGGVRHEYPPQTTITVVDEGCGRRFRWQPLRERWEEWATCPTPAGEWVRQLAIYHEFAGQSDERSFDCDEASLIRPAKTQPGTVFGARCAGDKANFTSTGAVVGVEPSTVGGATVETVHVRVEWEQTSSDIHSIRRVDQWLHTTSGLLVRQVYEDITEGKQGPLEAHYEERYELRLTSLTPHQ